MIKWSKSIVLGINMSRLPRVFIGSSSESYDVASACNTCMDRKAEGTLWTQIFAPGGTTLQSLTEKATNVDFALFIFTPDDLTRMRGNDKPTVRDNVLFELGLFIGSLGQERCFILKPRGEELYLPTDLLGLNTQDYNSNRSDDEIESAVNSACTQFLKQMEKLGHFQKKTRDFVNNPKVHKSYQLNDLSLRIIGYLLPSVTDESSFTYFQLEKNFNNIPQHKLNIGLIKLERAALIDRTIDSDFNGNEWYGYKLTTDGVEYALENEEQLDKLLCAPPLKPTYSYAQQSPTRKAT